MEALKNNLFDLQSPTTKFHIVEVNLISAQELKLPRSPLVARRGRRTYAVVWMEPGRKLRSRVDKSGLENPTWNDKFAFAVPLEEALAPSLARLVFEFYCVGAFGTRDKLVGTTRVLLGDFGGPAGVFRAFHVRPPNGEPQGVLNVGVRVLDGLAYEVISHKLVGGVGAGIDHNTPAGEKKAKGKLVRRFFDRFFVQKKDMNKNKEKKVYSVTS